MSSLKEPLIINVSTIPLKTTALVMANNLIPIKGQMVDIYTIHALKFTVWGYQDIRPRPPPTLVHVKEEL